MPNWLDELFKESVPVKTIMDHPSFILNELGGILIAVGFLTFGILCINMASISYPRSPARTTSVILFGWSLVGCGLSRAFEVYSLWHYYPLISGIIKVLTGLTVLVTLFLVPMVIKQTLKHKSLLEIEEQMKKTQAKVEDAVQLVKEIKSDS